jgi:hypothetical protein
LGTGVIAVLVVLGFIISVTILRKKQYVYDWYPPSKI